MMNQIVMIKIFKFFNVINNNFKLLIIINNKIRISKFNFKNIISKLIEFVLTSIILEILF